MIITDESQLLDIEVRKRVLQDIQSTENLARKAEAYKRYQCYKDKTSLYVLLLLLKQFDRKTVEEMRYALSNLGISRKVVDKLARVYKYGVDRSLYVNGEEQEDELLKKAAKMLQLDQALKKTNRFFKLFKNTALYIRPKSVGEDKFAIKSDPLPPYLYDVIEKADEREQPLAFILSNYSPQYDGGVGFSTAGLAVLPGTDGRNGQTVPMVSTGDGIDQTIADSPEDKDRNRFTWWTESFHFVTNEKGEIIEGGPEDMANPVEELPFVNYAEDQDGAFWAQGGDDLTDGAILINSMITNILHIGVTQGYGQLVMTGKDLPKQVKVGPNTAIRLTHEGEDPVPTFKFESANPPLDQLRALVEMYVALLLTTNNLSTSGVSSNLNGGASFPSGIAMLIDKSESMEDVEDQRQVFEDNEPKVWKLVSKWHRLLKSKNELPEKMAALDFPEDFEVRVQFNDPKPIETEKEALEVTKMKLDMGLISMIDAIKSYYPDLSDEEAKERLAEIMEEKMLKMARGLSGSFGADSNGNEDGSEDQPRQRPGRGEDGGRRVPGGAGPAEGSEPPKPSDG